MKTNYILTILVVLCFAGCAGKENYPFQDTTLPIAQRVDDLVARLTLEEKVAQMGSETPGIERLGILPYDWQNECLHGVGKIADYKVTVFPQPIGMAATWDKESIRLMADYTATEGRAIYNHSKNNGEFRSYYGLTYWAPNINIFRDPRWGRGHETFGEDPYLTTVLGKEFVFGLQGDDPTYLKASACAKHYAVHSGPESTRHEFNTEVSTYDLWDTYLPAFRDLVTEADVSGIMCAYNAYGGRPCCGNDLLMMDILRKQWGFKGYVTSDCGAIDNFYKHHKTHPDTISAAVDAVLHGTDLDCIRDVVFKTLVGAVKQGRIKEDYINQAVKRLFTIRFRLGMFDPDEKVAYAQIPLSVLDNNRHQEHALKMARQSIVLLKNENNTLPLKKKLRKIAIVGPNASAEIDLLGNYHGYPSQLQSIAAAIKAKVSPQTIVYQEKMVDYLSIDTFRPIEFASQCWYNNKPGFLAEYYPNLDFAGKPASRQEQQVAINYLGETKIINSISSLAFTARFTTHFVPAATSEYTLNLDTDKRFRLLLDDNVCIDALQGKAKADGRYIATLEKGKRYKITIEAVMKGRHGALAFNIGQHYTPTLKQLADKVKDADVIIFVGGISPALEGEQNGVQCAGFEDGDRTTIALPAIQTALMKELKQTGKPVVFVMLTGSALATEWESAHLDAIVNAWYGGQAGGAAVADVLFGDYNPAGRLPVTFYRSDKDLPSFTDYSMENRTYRYFKGDPLYPFGFGLSYTTFAYTNLKVNKESTTTSPLTVQVEVTNTGEMAGEEVAQLYLTHINKESYLPICALKGFERIFLKRGETRVVQCTLSPKELAVSNDFGELTVQPGEINISIGGRQPLQKEINRQQPKGSSVGSKDKEILQRIILLTGNKHIVTNRK